MTGIKNRWLQAAVCFLLAGPAAGRAWSSQEADFFQDRVQPILNRCVGCHSGPTPTGSLDLTNRESALKGGQSGAAIAPGRSTESLLYQMVRSKKMPPGDPLPDAQAEALREWIDAGAVWGEKLGHEPAGLDWWALQRLSRPAIPEVRNRPWVRNPIDAFILAPLEEKRLSPSPPAARITLIRRATYDLLGLPPTPQEIDAFLNDSSPDTYQRLLDRLLASPRYGERWGRHWLDVVRFGESTGYERDIPRDHAWRYRDYVIESFNQDKPYPRFVQEQIAGDVLEPIRREGIIAINFLVAGPWDLVGNSSSSEVMKARIREEELEDTISAVSQTFLGLTVNCARCHDHKFMPISQREYYRMKAVFTGIYHGDRSILTPAEIAERKRRMAPQKRRIARSYRELNALEKATRKRMLAKRGHGEVKEAQAAPIARWYFDVDGKDSVGELHATLPDGATLENGQLHLRTKEAIVETPPLRRDLREKTLEVWVALADPKQKSARIMTVENPKERMHDGISFGGKQPKWLTASELRFRTNPPTGPEEQAQPGEVIQITVVYSADHRITIYRNGVRYESYLPETTGPKGLLQTFPAQESRVVFGKGLEGGIDEARLYDRALSAQEVASSFRAGAPSVTEEELLEEMTEKQRKRWEALLSEVAAARDGLSKIPPVPLAYAGNPRKPGPTFILERGDPINPREPVTPGGLAAVRTLSPEFDLPADAPEGLRRRMLAEWITHPDNPLFARVMVNRAWHFHFGKGIVSTPNDFGLTGDRPSHPELLDWLAAEFTAQGWRLKKLHKLIMLSSTYRQSSQFNARAAEVDSENRLLWTFSPRRLEGEAIRDAMLAVSGQLNPQMGGAGFRPFTHSVGSGGNYFYTLTDPVGPEYNRRTVYRMNVNSAPNPLLENLDCPDPSTKTPRRSVTTTPLQALSLMNNSFVLRQAGRFAERLRREGGDEESRRVTLAYRLAFGRPPKPGEIERATALAREHGLENFCWTLLNASEFVYLD